MTKANFLSFLNIGDMIEESGSMRNCFEDKNQSYIQNVKSEISTIEHPEQYHQTTLDKILRTDVSNSYENNSISQTKKYSMTSHVRIYKKGQKYTKKENVFSHEDIVSGVISKKDISWYVSKKQVAKGSKFILSFLVTT